MSFPVADVGIKQLVPLLGVKSMEASLRFYLDGLGFTLTNKWTPEGAIRWCWLEHGGAAVMLQALRRCIDHLRVGAELSTATDSAGNSTTS